MIESPMDQISNFEIELEEEVQKKKWAKYPNFQYAFPHDIFPRFQSWKWLKARKADFGVPSKQYLAIKVFNVFMKKVIEDGIENNDYFKFPAYRAALVIEALPDEV